MYSVEAIDIRYFGFHPSEFTRSYMDEVITSLQNQLPDGSRIRAVIRREGKMLVANIDILSRWGKAFVPVKAMRLKQLCDQLEVRIHRQVKKWRDRQRRGKGGS